MTASIVGGGTGGRLSLEAIAASEYYKPLALADLRPEVGAELGRRFPELRTFTDFRGLFKLCPTDVVCVSTYPPSRETVTLEALINANHPRGLLIAPEEQSISLHQRHLENLLPMIASGQPDYSLPESSLRALEICEAAYLSGRHGVEIKFPLDQFKIPAPNDWQPGEPYTGRQGGRDGRKLS